MPKVYVNVHLKSQLLDPQGRAVFGILARKKLSGIVDVRQGKVFVLEFQCPITAELLLEVEKYASELLANEVIEDFSIEVKSDS